MKTLQNNPQFKAFASSIDFGIIVGIECGNIIDFNVPALKMFGYTEEELRDMPIINLIPKRFRKKSAGADVSSLVGQTVRMFGLHKNGKEFPIEMHLSQWHNTEGKQYFTVSLRKYSALENNLSWILASSAAATVTLIGVLIYLGMNF